MRRVNSIIALIMLGFMFVLMFFSSWNDSAIMDELAHIPAGYSYLTQHDYRLNPEHPPLIKDLAALPLIFLNLNFPTDVKAWAQDVNGQWDMGRIFLYESGNNPDRILHASRLPIMLLAVFFGWMLFRWVARLYGDKVGLMTLFFFAFSPTFIAHSRYVTTDLGAAFGFFIGIVAFLKFLSGQNKPSATKSLIIAGIVFGLVELLKFSLVLLAPLYVIFGLLWVILEYYPDLKKIFKEGLKMIGKIFAIGLIGLVVIIVVYQLNIFNYPLERQAGDAAFILGSSGFRPLANLIIWMAGTPALRALGHYFLGVAMVLQRSAGGNTAYFLGEVSAAGWKTYFPVLFLVKEHLAFIIFALIALIFSIRNILKAKEKKIINLIEWLRGNFVLAASMIFIAVYWGQALLSPLNIGVRHVLPTFPFIYLLVSWQIVRWLKAASLDNPKTIKEWVKDAYEICARYFKKYLTAGFLLAWIFLGTLGAFPYYLSYYNELAGGTFYGYKIAVDSNYDWGQDLKRLAKFVDINGIQKIALDYFGGGNPKYYLGDKFEPWWSAKGSPAEALAKAGQPPPNSWFAISATFLEEALASPAKGFARNEKDSYFWLKNKKPVARAGTSIFIYKF